MQHSIIRSGRHSLAVIIPAKFVQAMGIKAGDKAYIQVNISKGLMNVKFSGAMQLPLISQRKN